mgnify:CR=1 FL=1
MVIVPSGALSLSTRMNQQQPPPGITAQDWTATPATVQTLVRTLLELAASVEPLKQRVAELEARLGQALLAEEARVFSLWYRVRDGTLSWADFQVAMLPVMACVGALLREGAEGAHKSTQRTCRNLLKPEAALWTFVWEADVEPTNNNAERPLRRAVLWRRRSFGTQSAAGSQFVERILTAVTTLRQQQRDVLEYLTAACAAAIRGEQAPSLLPSGRPAPFTS